MKLQSHQKASAKIGVKRRPTTELRLGYQLPPNGESLPLLSKEQALTMTPGRGAQRGFSGDPGTVAHGWHANAKGTSSLLITPALEACPSTGVFLPPVCLSRDRAGRHHEVFSGRQLSHPPTADPCRHCLPSLFLSRPAWVLFHRKLMNSARAGGLLPPGLGNVGEVASLGVRPTLSGEEKAFCACSERRQLFLPRCLSL